MKKVSVFLLAIICASVVFGQQQKVAVYVTGGQNAGINKVLGDQLVAAFANSGKYIAIERTANFLAELGKEQNYQRTGAVDDNELSRLGKQFGVQLVCVADISDVFGQKYVSARLIDVESAEVVNTANVSSALSNMNELMTATQNITKALNSETSKEKATRIAKENADKAAKELAEKLAQDASYYILGNLAVQTGIGGKVDWETANKTAQSSKTGGFNDWRLPDIGELGTIYANKEKIWKRNLRDTLWQNTSAWSSSTCGSGHFVIIHDSYYDNSRTECYSTKKNAVIIFVRNIK